MKKKKRRAAVAVVARTRKAAKVKTPKPMLAKKHSAAIRQNPGKFCNRLTAISFVPKNGLDGVMTHSTLTL